MHILPKVQAGKTFCLWFAASSSGEDHYTLAMTLADGLSSTPWEIVASDFITRVLEKNRGMCHFMLPSRESKLVISQDGRYANEGIKLNAVKKVVPLHKMHRAVLDELR